MESPLPKSLKPLGQQSELIGSAGVRTESRGRGAGEFEDHRGDLYHLVLWEATGLGEATNEKGIYVPYRKEPGILSCFIPGGTFFVHAFNSHRAVFSHIRPDFLRGVEDEMDTIPQGAMRDHLAFADPSLRDLLRLLKVEEEENGAHGVLYSDSLNIAVATRLLLLGRNPRKELKPSGSLPPFLVRRCVEYMEANLGLAINIATLARQTGYSRAHFIKTFSAATGASPHRFLLNLRLEKARTLILTDAMSLIEVAALCGFSSQAHLTTAFGKRYGTAPAQFGRSFRKDHEVQQ